MDNINEVWIFNGSNGKFPSGVFSSKKLAEDWINFNKLTGVLTLYPVNISTYDWAIQNKFFDPRDEGQKTPEFIQKFSSGSQEHYHFEKGVEE